jgi:hypothetical protein
VWGNVSTQNPIDLVPCKSDAVWNELDLLSLVIGRQLGSNLGYRHHNPMEVEGQKTNYVRIRKEKRENGKNESTKTISIHGRRDRRRCEAVTRRGEIGSYF